MRPFRTIFAASAALVIGAGLGLLRRNAASDEETAEPSVLTRGRSILGSAIGDGLLSVSAAIAFYALLSLVPALSVLVSLWGLVSQPSDIPGQLAAIDLPLPLELRTIVVEQATRLAATSSSTLSWTLAGSLPIAVWSANAAVKGMFEGLGRMWGQPETRSFVRLNLVTIGFTLTAVAVVAATLFAFALFPVIAERAGGTPTATVLGLLRWPILLGLGFCAIVSLYRHGPDRKPPRLALQVPGAAFATVVWTAASAAFSWYVSTIGSYSATYGSLAGVVVVLTWAWFSAIVVLAGGEIAADAERREAVGTLAQRRASRTRSWTKASFASIFGVSTKG